MTIETAMMRIIKAIEADLNDRRGLHLSSLPADIRRQIRQGWKEIIRNALTEAGNGPEGDASRPPAIRSPFTDLMASEPFEQESTG